MNKLTTLTLVLMAACGSEAAPPSSAQTAGTETPAATDPGGATPSDPGTPATPSNPAEPTPATPPCTGKAALSGDLDWTIATKGNREVHVHVPTKYDPAKPTAVVLNFHGFTSNGSEQAMYTGMNRKADEAGFIAVHAEGVGASKQQSWNAGACCGEAVDTKVDDVALVSSIIDELQAKLCVDDKRIFATGMSNGGFLSHRLACDLSNRIAAVAPVAGVMGVSTCKPARPVPVMHFHGTLDPLVPYDGIDDSTRKFPSVAKTADDWATRNGCTDTARATFESGDAKCMTRDKCTSGSEVTVCTISGGGHTWPGAFPIAAMGYTSVSIRATDAMWEFFQKHPMP